MLVDRISFFTRVKQTNLRCKQFGTNIYNHQKLTNTDLSYYFALNIKKKQKNKRWLGKPEKTAKYEKEKTNTYDIFFSGILYNL